MSISRRDFLRSSAWAGAAGAAVTVAGCGQSSQTSTGNRMTAPGVDIANPFKHGVASGDPTSDAMIIWTRVTRVDNNGNALTGDVPVTWSVFSDPELTQPVASGNTVARADNDYCVKADVGGLSPYTAYYYRFSAAGFDSPIGRGQTLPVWDADTDRRLRIAVVSCSNFAHGFFHVYRAIAERNDIDLVIHLGDYLYEYGNGEYGDTRECDPPTEMLTLDDYRRRHAQYKTDPDLMELHRQYSFINIWDDHETTDNSRKCTAKNHTEGPIEEGGEGIWYERKSIGIQAYFEWIPIRPLDSDVLSSGQLFAPSVGRTWRKFSAGEFVDIVMIDTRLWGRDDEPVEAGAGFTREAVRDYQSDDPLCGDETAHRDILGPDQEAWLHAQLRDSTAKWKILGNQLILSHLRTTPGPLLTPATYLNTDAWDGYPTSQERLYAVLAGNNADGTPNPDNAVDNVVVITGDIHTSWAFDVTPDPDALPTYNPLAVEFVGPSVSSPGVDIPGETANALRAANLHLQYVNLDQRGWILLDLTSDYATGEWYHIGGDAVVDAPEYPGGPGALARVYRTPSTPGDNAIEINPTDPTGTMTLQTEPGEDYQASRPPKAP